ncbi:hypothetical protein HY639_03025 [Candidatus Woesearchaeota archaeon]|nr:hypothetical protein [Candidatus Woesearchaeota archaeon]
MNAVMASAADRLKNYGFEEDGADPDQPGFPKPLKRFKVTWETFGLSIEEPYFWLLDHLRESWGFSQIEKVRDIFTAAESSSFFGASYQRMGIHQDRAANYLSLIGKFVNDLFKMVREMRILKMRLDMYDRVNKGDRAADQALKGIWVDLVEGGTRNPSSVLGLAREVGFTILPPLFFSTYVDKFDIIEETVRKMNYNEEIKRMLMRKLHQYLAWKINTEKELRQREKFMRSYIKQHYEIIKLYMNWVRPYLLHVKRMGMDMSRLSMPDLISAFEGSILDIEFLAKGKKEKNFFPVILVHFYYRTRPAMEFHQEYQHRGPVHVGRVEITVRGYVWNSEMLEKYKQYRGDDDLELLGSINKSIADAMSIFKDDLKEYLTEMGEQFPEEKKAEVKVVQPAFDLFEPFKALGSAVWEPIRLLLAGLTGLFGIDLFKTWGAPGPSKKEVAALDDEKKKVQETLLVPLWKCVEIFKKTHGMLAW